MPMSYNTMLSNVHQLRLEGKTVASLDCSGVRFVTIGETQEEALQEMLKTITNYLSFTPTTNV